MKVKFMMFRIMKYVFIVLGVLSIVAIAYLKMTQGSYEMQEITYNSFLGIDFTNFYIGLGILSTIICFLISELMDWLITVENNQTIIIESLMQINHNITGIEAKQIIKNIDNKSDTL